MCILLLLLLNCNYRLFIISYFDEPLIYPVIIVRQLAVIRMSSIGRTRHSDKVVAIFAKWINRNQSAIVTDLKMLSIVLNDARICAEFNCPRINKPGPAECAERLNSSRSSSSISSPPTPLRVGVWEYLPRHCFFQFHQFHWLPRTFSATLLL